ncbi:MAG: hypothetical protein A2511_12450 [Deltaproteobacteria bacterium RIFOXYD12_FULL_50_9]|nr:MAG: hypothetical protein A2511_12450 [Deltaproteobacteria bacterium RIFOXYD12_FULL_50_9]
MNQEVTTNKPTLKPGTLFSLPFPGPQMPSTYLALAQQDHRFECARASGGEEDYTGDHDIFWSGLIIEVWNTIYLTSELITAQGCALRPIPSDILEDCLEIRSQITEDQPEYPNDPNSSFDEHTFQLIEKGANDALAKAIAGNSVTPLRIVPVWKKLGDLHEVITDKMKASILRTKLTLIYENALPPPQCLIWDSTDSFRIAVLAPDSNTNTVFTVWKKQMNSGWKAVVQVPYDIMKLALVTPEGSAILEILPSSNMQSAASLAERLFVARRESLAGLVFTSEPQLKTPHPYGVLEELATANHSGLRALMLGLKNHIGFAVAAGLCCQNLPGILQLELFQLAEDMTKKSDSGKEGQEIGALADHLKIWQTSKSEPDWICKRAFKLWDNELVKNFAQAKAMKPSEDITHAFERYADWLTTWVPVLCEIEKGKTWTAIMAATIKENLSNVITGRLPQPQAAHATNVGRQPQDPSSANILEAAITSIPDNWNPFDTAGTLRPLDARSRTAIKLLLENWKKKDQWFALLIIGEDNIHIVGPSNHCQTSPTAWEQNWISVFVILGHLEASVKKALDAVENIASGQPSNEDSPVLPTSPAEVAVIHWSINQ